MNPIDKDTAVNMDRFVHIIGGVYNLDSRVFVTVRRLHQLFISKDGAASADSDIYVTILLPNYSPE